MSTSEYKTALRTNLGQLDKDEVLGILNRMGLEYDMWSNGLVGEINDKSWDIYYGTETNNIYIDYVIARNKYDDPYFSGVIGMNEIKHILQRIPQNIMPELNNVRIVSYGYYNGTDEPEIF